jgi:hypothetical protein
MMAGRREQRAGSFQPCAPSPTRKMQNYKTVTSLAEKLKTLNLKLKNISLWEWIKL